MDNLTVWKTDYLLECLKKLKLRVGFNRMFCLNKIERLCDEDTIDHMHDELQDRGMFVGKDKIYVVGYMFNDDGTQVVLIHKNHPPAQNGLYNGVGGKVEYLEDPLLAMLREFREETGITVEDMTCKATELWQNTIVIKGKGWQVYYYRAFSTELVNRLKDQKVWPTDEPIKVFYIEETYNLYSHVAWTIHMSLASIKFPVVVEDPTPEGE